MAVRKGDTQQQIALTQTQMSKASQPQGRPAGQDSGTMKTLSKTEREREEEYCMPVIYFYLFTSHNLAFRGYTLPLLLLFVPPSILPGPIKVKSLPSS